MYSERIKNLRKNQFSSLIVIFFDLNKLFFYLQKAVVSLQFVEGQKAKEQKLIAKIRN